MLSEASLEAWRARNVDFAGFPGAYPPCEPKIEGFQLMQDHDDGEREPCRLTLGWLLVAGPYREARVRRIEFSSAAERHGALCMLRDHPEALGPFDPETIRPEVMVALARL